MPQTFRLAHLSDPHLGPMPVFWPWHWNIKRAFGFANWMAKRRYTQLPSLANLILDDVQAQNLDHIAISGDLTNIGMPAEYRLALAWLKRAGPADRVSTVPGNHDVYCRLRFDRGVSRWAPYMSSTAERQPSKHCQKRCAVSFPYVRRWSNIALIGVNSAIPTPTGCAAGRVDQAQMQRLEEILVHLDAQRVCRIIMIHHPPLPGQTHPTRALRNADKLENVLVRVGAELVIHGHNHRAMLEYRQWQGRRFPIVGVPSCSAVATLSSPAAYNIYVITNFRENCGIEVIRRQVSRDASTIDEAWRQRLTP